MNHNILRCTMSGLNAGGLVAAYHEKTQAYLDELPSYTPGFAAAIDTYVRSIFDAGVFDTDDDHYIFANETLAGSYVNLMAPAEKMTLGAGTPVLDQYTGVSGDGTAAYLISPKNYNALTKLSDTNSSMGIAVVDTSAVGTIYDLGLATGDALFASRQAGHDEVYCALSSTSVIHTSLLTDLSPSISAPAYYNISLFNLSETMQPYQNGVPFTFTDTATYPSSTRPSLKITFLGVPGVGVYSARKYGLFHMGASINSTQATARNAAWVQLQSDLAAL